MSECYFNVSCGFGELKDRIDSCGRITVNQESKVVDEEGRVVPHNETGELWIRGYTNFLEYKNQPELTKSILTRDGWLKTG